MGKYRKTRKQKNKKKKIIIISALSLLLMITVGYAAFQTNLTITAKGNIKEKSRVIRVWDNTSKTDFHTDFYKQNIVSATFLDNNNVPSNATESWNVSEDKENGGVIAWVVPNNEDNTKYDLYIGAKGGVIANEDSSFLFFNFQNVKTINFNNNFNTSNATSMLGMFMYCTGIETIDISSFDTSNVIYMGNMFNMYNSTTSSVIENKLTNIIFGDNFTTKNVTSISQMFVGCENLTHLDIANWDTSNITVMNSAFAHCHNLQSLDLSKWDTSNVTEMAWMFLYCTNLVSLNISNFNTSKVTNMYQMFRECRNLESLDLCSFNTSNVTDMRNMFQNTNVIKQIKVGSNWTTTNADTTNMFQSCGVSSVTTGEC